MLPFDRYREGGRKLLGKNRHDDRCRTKYGPRVFRECGTACVYCERELGASYDAWLGISVDHVIGQSAVKKYGYPADFIEDLANQVTCCRPCNEFVQDEFGIPKTPPSGPGAFFDLVESVSPGPYLELFARRQRLGWDTWGNEALEHVKMGEA